MIIYYKQISERYEDQKRFEIMPVSYTHLDVYKRQDKDSVVLTVHREGEEDAMEITVPVTDVELPSVFHEMLDSKIGYIRIRCV